MQTTPNPLQRRNPELIKSFAAFRSRIGDILLEELAPMIADPRFRDRRQPLTDIYAAAKILNVLVKDKWTEQDLDTFDTYWRDAMRSDLFADEFEAERHRIQASVQSARADLLESEVSSTPAKVVQPTLW